MKQEIRDKIIQLVHEESTRILSGSDLPTRIQQNAYNRVHGLNLKKAAPKYSQEFRKNRILAFDRDGYRCQYCGKGLENKTTEGYPVILHADHIIPRSKGGSDDLGNLRTACEECNLGKSDMILD